MHQRPTWTIFSKNARGEASRGGAAEAERAVVGRDPPAPRRQGEARGAGPGEDRRLPLEGLVRGRDRRAPRRLRGPGPRRSLVLVRLWTALLDRTVLVMTRISFVSERLLRRALDWVDQVAHELRWDESQLSKSAARRSRRT